MQAGQTAGLPQSVSVQVLDITVAGVLFQMNRPVKVGSRVPLRLVIDGRSFSTDVAVVRVLPMSSAAGTSYQVGAKFVSMAPENRQIIERFTHQ
jgi:hypothetical protein